MQKKYRLFSLLYYYLRSEEGTTKYFLRKYFLKIPKPNVTKQNNIKTVILSTFYLQRWKHFLSLIIPILFHKLFIYFMEKHETQLNNWRRKYRERNNEKEVKQNWKQTFDLYYGTIDWIVRVWWQMRKLGWQPWVALLVPIKMDYIHNTLMVACLARESWWKERVVTRRIKGGVGEGRGKIQPIGFEETE